MLHLAVIHRVSIDEIYEPHFTYHDPTLNISPDPSKKLSIYFYSFSYESLINKRRNNDKIYIKNHIQ